MTDARISAFARSSMETPVPPESSSMTFDSGYSPTPGADQSSYSSPGSASDHMGAMSYSTQLGTQPLYPGSAVLSAFEQQKNNTHVNRVITTTNSTAEGAEQQPQDPLDATSKPPERRQKRLERNRESARLSRRRRKHYLENLEVRVNQLSSDLDQMRRGHVLLAVSVVAEKRLQQIAMGQQLLPAEQPQLSFTSNEIMIASSFQAQQLKSFSVPPSAQFVMWLTLQTDNYFRGGRAASERLSAARIGERVSKFTQEKRLWCSLVSHHAYQNLTRFIFVCPFAITHHSHFINTVDQYRNVECCTFAVHVASLLQRNWPFL